MQKILNTLKQNTVTITIKDIPLTIFADHIKDVQYAGLSLTKPVESAGGKEYFDENGIRFVDIKTVAEYYGVTTETVRNWIKSGKISGKQLSGHRGKWFIPLEEFEYLKQREAADSIDADLKKLLGDDYDEDFEFELDEE